MRISKSASVALFVFVVVLIVALYGISKKRSYDAFQSQEIDLSQHEQKIFSQNAEDGATMKIIELLYDNPKNKYYVEFGVENGSECNTRVLREKYDWKGLMMDGSNENSAINLKKEYITKDNVVSLFEKYNVPNTFNLLCVDIDYNDYYCLAQILKKYTCDVLILEYNATHLPTEDKVVQYEESTMWDGSNYFGASLLAFNKLCTKHGYTLVYCDKSGTNSFYIRDTLLKERGLQFKNMGDIHAIYRAPKYGSGPNGGHPVDRRNRAFLTSDAALALV